MKIMVGIVIGVALAALAFLAYPSIKTVLAPGTATTTGEGDGTVCIQVVTSARDPKTGSIKIFPTPCDVPQGWEVIQNDVPGL